MVKTEIGSRATLDSGLWTLNFIRPQPDNVRYINQSHRPAGLINHRKFTDFTARKHVTGSREQVTDGRRSGRAGHNVDNRAVDGRIAIGFEQPCEVAVSKNA